MRPGGGRSQFLFFPYASHLAKLRFGALFTVPVLREIWCTAVCHCFKTTSKCHYLSDLDVAGFSDFFGKEDHRNNLQWYYTTPLYYNGWTLECLPEINFIHVVIVEIVLPRFPSAILLWHVDTHPTLLYFLHQPVTCIRISLPQASSFSLEKM